MSSNPNILIIITHDTGRHLGCYGRRVETPNLDRMAEEGVKFSQCFCTAAQCSPSRAGLITGMVPHSNGLIGLTHRGFRLNPNVRTLPSLLVDAGYSTILFGFQHEAPDARLLGYKEVVKSTNRSDSCLAITPHVVNYLLDSPPEPFFAMVGFSETHRKFPESNDPIDDIKVPPYLPDEPEVRRDIADLYMSVRRADSSIGEIINALERANLADKALVIYTTDHGIAFPGAKATLFDPGLEIAMIAKGLDDFREKHIDCIVSNIDVLPTLMELIGCPVPDGVQGKSLLPLLRGEADSLHEYLFPELTYHAAYDPMRGVRTDRYKYIRSYEDRPFSFPPNVDDGYTKRLLTPRGYFDVKRPAEMLFDLSRDPNETENLVDNPEYASILNHLRNFLANWMQQTDDPLLKGFVPPYPGAYITPPDSFEP